VRDVARLDDVAAETTRIVLPGANRDYARGAADALMAMANARQSNGMQ